VVLEQHPKAKELYEVTKDCISLPGVQESFSTIERRIPESDKLLKGIMKKAGYKKNSKPEDNPAKSARRLITGAIGLITSIKSRLMLPILISSKRRHDLKLLAKSIDNFITIGLLWTETIILCLYSIGNVLMEGQTSRCIYMVII
jgi:hypothetical protein